MKILTTMLCLVVLIFTVACTFRGYTILNVDIDPNPIDILHDLPHNIQIYEQTQPLCGRAQIDAGAGGQGCVSY